jgi:hypothetical protein
VHVDQNQCSLMVPPFEPSKFLGFASEDPIIATPVMHMQCLNPQ